MVCYHPLETVNHKQPGSIFFCSNLFQWDSDFQRTHDQRGELTAPCFLWSKFHCSVRPLSKGNMFIATAIFLRKNLHITFRENQKNVINCWIFQGKKIIQTQRGQAYLVPEDHPNLVIATFVIQMLIRIPVCHHRLLGFKKSLLKSLQMPTLSPENFDQCLLAIHGYWVCRDLAVPKKQLPESCFCRLPASASLIWDTPVVSANGPNFGMHLTRARGGFNNHRIWKFTRHQHDMFKKSWFRTKAGGTGSFMG